MHQTSTTLQSYENAMKQLDTTITSIQSLIHSFGTRLDAEAQKMKNGTDLATEVNTEATAQDLQHDFTPPSPVPDDLVSNYFHLLRNSFQARTCRN